MYGDYEGVFLLSVFVDDKDVACSSIGSMVYSVVKVHLDSHYVMNISCLELKISQAAQALFVEYTLTWYVSLSSSVETICCTSVETSVKRLSAFSTTS